ncbi:MAG: hypothetical protein ACSLEL_04755 [Candidatus Malihini olakiniferum]
MVSKRMQTMLWLYCVNKASGRVITKGYQNALRERFVDKALNIKFMKIPRSR